MGQRRQGEDSAFGRLMDGVWQWLWDGPTAGRKLWVFCVERFLSNGINRVDAKGRVSVPAQFRAALQTKQLTDLYALASFDMPAIDTGGMDLLEAYEAELGRNDPLSKASIDFSIYIHGEATFLKLDSAGRITISDFIRAHTGITDEVQFVGRGTFFQMWEPEKYAIFKKGVFERMAARREAGEL